jgi:Putative peptidoglycan binding domain
MICQCMTPCARRCYDAGFRAAENAAKVATGSGLSRASGVRMRAGWVMAALGLMACEPAVVEAPMRADLTLGQVLREGDTPPGGPTGQCWDRDIIPAVIETETEQVLVQAEVRDADGVVVTPAIFSSESRQRMVQDRAQVWFPAPCAVDMTLEFVATLQRALKARGFYLLPLTGIYDAPTMAAVRRYQATRGLDSPKLSLGAARELGIVAADFTP